MQLALATCERGTTCIVYKCRTRAHEMLALQETRVDSVPALRLQLGAAAFSDRLGPLAGHQRVAGGGRVHAVLSPVVGSGASGDSAVEHALKLHQDRTELLRELFDHRATRVDFCAPPIDDNSTVEYLLRRIHCIRMLRTNITDRLYGAGTNGSQSTHFTPGSASVTSCRKSR